jgi:hypothetical protein
MKAESPNFIFVSSAVLILTSIRKWDQSEMCAGMIYMIFWLYDLEFRYLDI